MPAKFKVGDKVRITKAVADHEFSGREGVVSRVDGLTTRVSFAEPVLAHGHQDLRYGADYGWNFFDGHDVLAHVAAPTIASDLKLTPQARTILKHLKKHGHITPMRALAVYGVTRLASCIHEIRNKAGYFVSTEVVRDDVGHKYADYFLAA